MSSRQSRTRNRGQRSRNAFQRSVPSGLSPALALVESESPDALHRIAKCHWRNATEAFI
jgi:hypothetical protein